jgi:hypothetical protein
MANEPPIFQEPIETPEELQQAAREQGWPEGLLDRACELRVRRSEIDRWLRRGMGYWRRAQKLLDRRERLIGGTLRVREATWKDDEAIADLYANSPENVGEWELTVERSPYPFAQFRLQENASIQVIEDRGVILAAISHSARNTLVGAKRVTVQIESAWRTREDARGQRLGRLLRTEPRRALGWEALATYYYRRQGGRKQRAATVHCFPSRPFSGQTDGIRLARRSDARRCVALVNRTHRGLDLFRPYTGEYLQGKLDDTYWGPKPDSWVAVYGWQDYYVLEETGRIIACAGLWDRGRHVREVWRHKTAGKSRVVENTALMDFGYAEGREDVMARLIAYLIGATHDLGRGQLMAPLQFLPSVVEALAGYEPVKETRPIYWQATGAAKALNVTLTRPYVDLAYW